MNQELYVINLPFLLSVKIRKREESGENWGFHYSGALSKFLEKDLKS